MKMNAKTKTLSKALACMLVFFSCVLPYFSCKQKKTTSPQDVKNEKQEITVTLECDAHIKLKNEQTLKVAKNSLWKDVKPKITSKILSVDDGWEIAEWFVGGAKGVALTPAYKFEKDEKVFISASAEASDEASYTVEHWKEKLDGSAFELAEKEEKKGMPLQDTEAIAKTYQGFKHREFSQQKISEDSSTVIKIYYDRLIVSLQLNLNGGTTSTHLFDGNNGRKILKGKAGTPVVLQAPTRKNATFKGFNPQLPQDFPNGDDEKVYEAQWEDALPKIIKITITGDERLDLEEPISMNVDLEDGKTWGDVKEDVREKVKLKKDWTGFWGKIDYYDVYQWRIGDVNGEVLRDGDELKKDITVFAVTNYIKFRIQDGVLQGYENEGLKGKPRGRIVIPEEIIKIDPFSFPYCKDITGIDFSQCTKLQEIEGSSFFECDRIESIDFSKCPDLKKLDGFERCANLKSVNLTGCSKLKVLDGFVGCTALKNIDLSPCPNIEELGAQVFNECVSLQSIDLSPCPKIKKIGGLAFKRCMSLKEIDLSCCPDIEEMQTCVFQECKNLKKIKNTHWHR